MANTTIGGEARGALRAHHGGSGLLEGHGKLTRLIHDGVAGRHLKQRRIRFRTVDVDQALGRIVTAVLKIPVLPE